MKRVTSLINVYRCIKPYRNWYNIMTSDGFNDINVTLIGKSEVLKVIMALTKLLIFNKYTIIRRYRKEK